MKKIFYLIFFASFFVIALSTFSSKALAVSCTISSGNTEDYEGLIVHVAVLDNKGNKNNAPPITGYTMNLTSNANGGTGGDAGIIRVNANKTVNQGPYAGVQFSPVTSGCTDTNNVDSYNAGDMVLDYGTSSQNVSGIPSSPNNSSGWVLMCGTSTDPGSNNGDGRNFTMSMNGHPSGYADGGTWLYYFDGDKIPHTGSLTWNLSDKNHGAINGLTMQFNAVYVEPSPPPTTIQGAVYSPSGIALDNVPISGTNVPGGVTTGSPHPGWFSFNETIGNWFSIHAQDPFIGTNGHKYSAVKITPYIGGVDRSAGATSCSFNGTNYSGPTSYSGYEWQNANSPNSGTAQCNYGLSTNGGYDFHYTKEQYAKIDVSANVTPSGAYPGTIVNFTGSASVSQTLSDDGADTYIITTTPSIAPPNAGDATFAGSTCAAFSTQSLRPETTKTLSCNITIPAAATAGTKYCVTTSISSYPSYVSVSGNNPIKCVTVLRPPSIVIGPQSSHEIGSSTPGDISYTLNCNSFTGSLTYNITVSPTGPHSISGASASCSSGISINGLVGNTPSFLDTLDPNIYSYTPIITSAIPGPGQAAVPGIPISGLSSAVTVYTVPYARFYGNNIASGSGSIYFNNLDNQPLTTSSSSAGSAAQYAAIAKTTILIATAAFRSTAPASPIGLSALTSAQVAIASTNNTSGATWANNWSTSGYYGDTTATTTINAARSVASKITIVGNDIYITGNITIDSTKLPSPSNLFDNASIPVITLIAKNNIYIDPSVTQIDALLQATNDIYTCSTGAAATPSAACSNTLLVNGAVGASNAIHFDRVCGTRLSATSTEGNTAAGTYMTNTNPNCSGSYKSGTAAEVINFPSYLYFASPYTSGATQTQYQSIYSAPPLL